MEYEYNDRSLRKHRVSRLDANEVLAVGNMTTREFDMPLADNYNLRTMFVGFNYAARLLEIGVELISENKAYVFHGQTVSPHYRELYKETIDNE
jgi:hypothetical protein